MAANNAAVSSFSFNASTVLAVGSAAISNSRAPIEVTSIGQAKQYFVGGVMGTTLSLDVYFSSADHIALSNALTSATAPVAFEITYASGSSSSGSAYVTQFDIVASAGDVVRANITLVADGTVTNLGTASYDGPLD